VVFIGGFLCLKKSAQQSRNGLAGRSGRVSFLEINCTMATAFVDGRAPGIRQLEFMSRRAGRNGRTRRMEFTTFVATAFVFM
jgi:hypothetical protein